MPRYSVFDRLKQFLEAEFKKKGGESLVCSTEIDHLPKSRETKPRIELRDYFAAHAMQGWLLVPQVAKNLDGDFEGVATWSYHMADAMMKAREA